MIQSIYLTIARWRRAGRIAALVLASAALLTGSNAGGQHPDVPSHDERMVTVPQVAGRTAADAIVRLALTGLGAALGAPEQSLTVPAGRVIRSIPAAGARVERGSWVQYILSRGPPPGVAVPQLAGRTETEAIGLLARVGLNAASGGAEESSTYPARQVTRSIPPAGERVRRGSRVQYFLSSGAPMVAVPQLAGSTETEAIRRLTEASLGAGPGGVEESSTYPAGQVTRSIPPAGERVRRGSRVQYFLSSGAPMVAVPRLEGLTEAAAIAQLDGAGLRAVSGAPEESSAFPAGQVVRSVPPAGERVRRGSEVRYILSSGAPLVAVPRLEGLTETAAIARLDGAGLRAAPGAPEESSAFPAGQVVHSVPPAGEQVGRGSVVRYVLSLGAAPVTVPPLEGRSEMEAVGALEQAGLVAAPGGSEESGLFSAGQVVRSDPGAGERVPRGSAVRYVLSLGPPHDPRGWFLRWLEDNPVRAALIALAILAAAIVAKLFWPRRPKFAVRLAGPPRGRVDWGEPPNLTFDVRVVPPKARMRRSAADPDEEGI